MEHLAVQTLDSWQVEAKHRGMTTPSPAAVSWVWADGDVGRRVDEARSTILTAGVVTQLREQLYDRPGERTRLVILGEPGAGKTAAMLLLLIDVLQQRSQGSAEPVPVWVTLGGWNPQTTSVREWSAAALNRDFPGLRAIGHDGQATARHMLDTGRVALFLDGLDELPADLQGPALKRIDLDTVGLPLVLTSRPREYKAALAQNRLYATSVINVLPVDLEDAATFLLAEQLDPQWMAWQRVIDQMRAQPHSVAARTLTSPLALSLARETYKHADPAELLNTTIYSTPETLLQHLLTRSLTFAYPVDSTERQDAIRWLSWIAYNMGTSRDLRWWAIPAWRTRAQRLTFGIGFCLVLSLMAGLLFGLVSGLPYGPDLGFSRFFFGLACGYMEAFSVRT